MSERLAAYRQCSQAHAQGHVIPHGTARTIASWYQDSDDETQAFVTTGAIINPHVLWFNLVHCGHRNRMYEAANSSDRFMLQQLAVYILTYGERGPVDGWANMWSDR